MAVYLIELQNAYPNKYITNEYVEVANLFAPSMPLENSESYNESDDSSGYNNPEVDNNPTSTSPADGQSPTPFISPGGGQFTINNCRRMAIVRIEMRRGFNPSNFFMVVDRADRRSIQGFRIACESGRIRFIPVSYTHLTLPTNSRV